MDKQLKLSECLRLVVLAAILCSTGAAHAQIMLPILAGASAVVPPATTPSIVQEDQASIQGSSTATCTVPAHTYSNGNLLYVLVSYAGTSPVTFTISDPTSGSNTYTLIENYNGHSDSNAHYYAKNITGWSSGSVVVTAGSSQVFWSCSVREIQDASISAPLDTFFHGTAAGTTSVTSATFTTAGSKELIVAGTRDGSLSVTWTAGTICGVSATAGNTITGNFSFTESVQLSLVCTNGTADVSTSGAVDLNIVGAAFKP